MSPSPLYVLIPGCFAASPGAITADWRSANSWNRPFGAGSEMTSGLVSARNVFSRGASASAELMAAVSNLSDRNRAAWTATVLPGAATGFAALVQKAFVPWTSMGRTAWRCTVLAPTTVAEAATARTSPIRVARRALVLRREPRR